MADAETKATTTPPECSRFSGSCVCCAVVEIRTSANGNSAHYRNPLRLSGNQSNSPFERALRRILPGRGRRRFRRCRSGKPGDLQRAVAFYQVPFHVGAAGHCGVSIRISQERSEIEIDGHAVRLRQRLEFDCANGKGAHRIIDAVLSKLAGDERPFLRPRRVVLNCLIEVSHHFIKIISFEIVIERPDKTFGFLLRD